jgi:hypothetical protein
MGSRIATQRNTHLGEPMVVIDDFQRSRRLCIHAVVPWWRTEAWSRLGFDAGATRCRFPCVLGGK